MLKVFQEHLDAVSDALMSNDFEAYLDLITVPLVIITAKLTLVMTETADVKSGFDSYGELLRMERATHLLRLAHTVTELGPNLITGRYETHVLRSGQRIYGPFQSAMSLRCVKGRWCVCSLVNPPFEDTWPVKSIYARAGQKAGV